MLDYDYQSKANISSFFEEKKYLERKTVLLKLISLFKEKKVEYAVACSFNLFLRGITDDFHDFDFIVDINSIPIIQEVMEKMEAELVETGGNGVCESNRYFHYQIGRVDIDIISGFRILTFGTELLYEYNSRELSKCFFYEENTIEIPLISAEALFMLYAMMEGWQPQRRYKRLLIGEYLEIKKLKFPKVFRKYLKSTLPGWIQREVRRLIIVAD